MASKKISSQGIWRINIKWRLDMVKLNSIICRKLLAQAEEAKETGMIKLANSIDSAVSVDAEVESIEYSYNQLEEDVHKDLWKAAVNIIKYYNLESADAKKLDKSISVLASEMISEIEQELGVDTIVVGPNEPKVFGQK